MNSIQLIISAALILASCQKKEVSPDPPGNQGALTLTNIPYGSHPEQKMDIYLPAGRTTASTKVMVLIHGGAWNTGDKSDFDVFVDTMKKREPAYAIFNINYRLANAPHLFPAQELDVKAAIEFIAGKSAEYKTSQTIVLIGASAGAHLALLQAYKYSLPVKIKAVIDFYGPTELVSLYNNPPNPLVPAQLFAVTGHSPATNLSLYQQSSPINLVTPQSPPTMILHGALDIVVSPSQSTLLRDELQAKAVAHEYVLYPSEGHVWLGATLTDSFNRIAAFLATHVP